MASENVPTTQEYAGEGRLDRHGYLFGLKITHSLSPELHSIIYKALGLKWEQLRLDSADVSHFLDLIRHPKCYGASITMPNKISVMQHLDELTDECRDVGACNTIFIRERNGQRIKCGTNTDVTGVRESFYRNVPDPENVFHGRPALVLGGGGAARGAIYALRKGMNVTDIYLVNRYKAEVDAVVSWCRSRGYGDRLRCVTTVEQAESLPAPGAIVACIPDLPPKTPEEKLARRIFEVMLRKERKGAMLEMCYNPTPWTELAALASEEGWQVIPGTEALIWQGLEQDRYWTGKEVDELPVRQVQEAIAQRLLSSRL